MTPNAEQPDNDLTHGSPRAVRIRHLYVEIAADGEMCSLHMRQPVVLPPGHTLLRYDYAARTTTSEGWLATIAKLAAENGRCGVNGGGLGYFDATVGNPIKRGE